MRSFVIILLIGVWIAVVASSQFNVINSAVKDCAKDNEENPDNCRFVCEFEGIKLSPGSGDYDNGKCIALFCNEDYTITVDTCEKKEFSHCIFRHDYKMPFPDCCNKVCQSLTQLHDGDEHS